MNTKETISTFVTRQRMTFALVDDGTKVTDPITIIESATGKTISLTAGEVTHLEEARDGVRGSRYLRLRLEDGRNFVLAGVGFVFAPSFISTGPLVDCPPTACFADFNKLYHHLCHLVEESEQGRDKEAMQVLMVLLAYLDGARAIGLDVGPEEERLEEQLKKLESRGFASA